MSSQRRRNTMKNSFQGKLLGKNIRFQKSLKRHTNHQSYIKQKKANNLILRRSFSYKPTTFFNTVHKYINNYDTILDENTIAIAINTHGSFIDVTHCIDVAQPEIELFNKVTMGELNMCNWNSANMDILFNKMSKDINFYYINNKPINFHSTCFASYAALNPIMNSYKAAKLDFKVKGSMHVPTKNNTQRTMYDVYSTRTHDELYYNKEHTNFNSEETRLLVKNYETDHSFTGINLLFDGKKDKSKLTLLYKNYILLPDAFRTNKLDKSGNSVYEFNTINLIQFLLSNGYSKLLIYDISCNIMNTKNVNYYNLCSHHY